MRSGFVGLGRVASAQHEEVGVFVYLHLVGRLAGEPGGGLLGGEVLERRDRPLPQSVRPLCHRLYPVEVHPFQGYLVEPGAREWALVAARVGVIRCSTARASGKKRW